MATTRHHDISHSSRDLSGRAAVLAFGVDRIMPAAARDLPAAGLDHATPAAANMTLDAALQLLRHGVDCAPSPNFPPEVNERLATAADVAAAQCRKAPPEANAQVLRLLDVSLRAPTGAKRIAWHRRAADALAAAYAPHAACHAGCSHCCHIPVKISALEAREVGRAIGRKPVPSPDHAPVAIAGYASPCSFLQGGRCSIYAHRPAVCRTHLNMDVDDLLCRLLPSGHAVPVPFLDTRAGHAVSMLITGDGEPMADLRQWFPALQQEAGP